jgi:hypothetical protein
MPNRVNNKTVQISRDRDTQSDVQTRIKAKESNVPTHAHEPLESITCKVGDTACAAKHTSAIQRNGLFRPLNENQKTRSLLRLQQQYGNRFVQRLIYQPAIQTKFTLGKPGDAYEQEADHVADRIMNMPEPQVQRQPQDDEEEEAIQLKSIGEQITPMVQKQPEDEDEREEEEEAIQTKSASGVSSEVNPELETSINGLMASGGQVLPKSTRDFFEPRFGYDFSGVKIHSDSKADMLNRELNSRAFTTGNDIFFGQGQYNPDTSSGRRLLAHELTHTVQQQAARKMVQADFAVPPTTPGRNVPTLSAARIQDAITYNQARHTDATEIGLMRDILGISATPAVIDADFVNAVVRYQAQYGLQRDGRLGHDTADRLAREIIAESQLLGPGNLGSLAPEFNLKTSLRTLITANNRTYADYRNAIQGATMLQQHVALRDRQLLRDLKRQLSWNNWARCIELLGRRAPSGNRMRRNATVRAALAAAWTASTPAVTIWPTHSPAHVGNACNPPPAGAPPTTAHEEGGFIYMNLITGNLTTRRVAAGGQAALVLTAPPVVANSIVVGGFHTHPNVGACWGAPFFSGADNTWTAHNGVPLLMRGAFPGVANTSDHATGNTRRHLAGNRGLPGAAGGLAPQANKFGESDEL